MTAKTRVDSAVTGFLHRAFNECNEKERRLNKALAATLTQYDAAALEVARIRAMIAETKAEKVELQARMEAMRPGQPG